MWKQTDTTDNMTPAMIKENSLASFSLPVGCMSCWNGRSWLRLLLVFGFLAGWSAGAIAQNLTEAEFFWDTDPGQGNGISMLAKDGAFDQVVETALSNNATIPAIGLHTINVRFKDDLNNWGPLFTAVIYIQDQLLNTLRDIHVDQAEFFWNTDPGQGNGTPLLAVDGAFDQALEAVFASNISYPGIGIHTFNIRIKDADGGWGPVFSNAVDIQDALSNTLRDIAVGQAEFFWNTDPGQGNGTVLLALDGNFDQAFEAVIGSNISYPGIGVHSFNVRVRSADGGWGPVFTTAVNIGDNLTNTLRDIAVGQAEFFWNTDPGQGNGTVLLALDGNFDQAIEAVYGSGIAHPGIGMHTFNLRVRGADGVWGTLFTTTVSIEDELSNALRDIHVAQAEAFWNSDPGEGNGIPLLALNGNFENALETAAQGLNTGSLPLGPHGFYVRMKGAEGNWGPAFGSVVFVDTSGAPNIDTIYGPAGICSNDLSGHTYWVDSVSGNTYQWSITNGTILSQPTNALVSVDWNTTGPHRLILEECNVDGCDSDTLLISVNANPLADAGVGVSFCQGDSVQLGGSPAASGGTSPYSYNWTPSSGLSSDVIANPWAKPVSSTTYKLEVTDDNGCTDTTSVAITLENNPVASAGNNAAICAGDTITLTASGGNSYLWDNGTNTASISVYPANTTNYSVTVTNVQGCSDNASVTVTVNPLPIITLNADTLSSCDGDSVQIIASGGNSYTWSPQPGLSCTTCPDPKAAPAASTDYALTLGDANGCTSDTIVVVNILNGPVASLTPGNGSICGGDSLQLLAGGGVNYSWSPGTDVSCMTCPDPYVTPSTTTSFTVTVTDGQGCTDIASAIVTVNPSPVADFSGLPVCLNDTTVFVQNSTVSSGAITGYLWDFGDGSTSALASPLHQFSTIGQHNVSLEVISDIGCVGTIQQTVEVYALPQSLFTLSSNGCTSDSVIFLNASTPPGSNYSWDFGDLNTSNLEEPTHLYSSAGTYTISLVVESAQGCSDTSTASITISPTPDVNFSANNTCLGDTTYFTDLSSISTGVITSWVWDFDDASPNMTIQNPDHIYTTANTFNVALTVISDMGCSGLALRPVTVYPLPSQPTITVNGNMLAASSASAYQWYLNGNPIPGANSQFYEAEQSGIYTVMISDGNGCQAVSEPESVVISGVALLAHQDSWTFYPNPFREQLHVNAAVPGSATVVLKVSDMLGKTLYLSEQFHPGGNFQHLFPLSNFTPGVYLITITYQDKTIRHKVIKGG